MPWKHTGNLCIIAGTTSLGCQPGSSHAKKTKAPEYHVYHHGAYGYTPYKTRIAQMSRYGCVTQAQQRHCYIA